MDFAGGKLVLSCSMLRNVSDLRPQAGNTAYLAISVVL